MSRRKITAAVVDDEVLARKFIRRLLKEDHDIEIVGECGNGKEAVSLIRKLRPDVLFLDVQMPEMDGFAVLEMIGTAELPEVVFTTAYDQYAIRAFELHALDYLLKPFDQARFADALKHVKERLGSRHAAETRLQIGALLENVKKPTEYLERLVIKSSGRITFLKTRDIEWIEADDKYVHLHTANSAPMVRQTLSAIEAQLDPKVFLRIHRSTIVNLERVRELQPLFNGEHSVTLESGKKLVLSRSYRDKAFQLLGRPL